MNRYLGAVVIVAAITITATICSSQIHALLVAVPMRADGSIDRGHRHADRSIPGAGMAMMQATPKQGVQQHGASGRQVD